MGQIAHPWASYPLGGGRFASGTGAKRPCYNNFKLLNIFLKYAPLSLYSYGISTRLNYVWLCISTPGASIPIPWWRRCATSEIGGRLFGSLGRGRTKNIDVLMIVMLKLANGFSDYE